MEWGRQMVLVNHFYFYLWDPEWGPAFWKTNAYAPFPIWLWLNGHSWAQRQLQKAGIAFEALDNGFSWCADTRQRSSAFATDWVPVPSTPSSGAGSTGFPRHLLPTTFRRGVRL